MYSVFFIHMRYRMLIEPVLLLFAGYAWSGGWRVWVSRDDADAPVALDLDGVAAKDPLWVVERGCVPGPPG